jgi:hypothetical protein
MNNPYQQPQARNPYLDPTAPTNTPSVGAVPPDGAPPEPTEGDALLAYSRGYDSDVRATYVRRHELGIRAVIQLLRAGRPSEPGTTAQTCEECGSRLPNGELECPKCGRIQQASR